MAKKTNKTVGEVKNIQLIDRQIPSIGRDLENYTEVYNSYNYSKFEMDFRDKVATCNVRVIYELK